MKRLLSLFVMTLVSVSMAAEFFGTFEVDDLHYEITSSKDKTVKVRGYHMDYSHSGNIVIPENVEYDGTVYSITAIGSAAFEDCFRLKSITIPVSVNSIGSFAFFRCSSLQSVKINNSITTIGRYAFDSCRKLKTIDLGDSVTSIEKGAFDDCSSITSIIIPNSVTFIGEEVFSGCTNLTSITIPNGVPSIESHTFSGCSSLTTITIPNSVTTFKYGAFSGCSSLKNINLPYSVTTIEDDVFTRCNSLTSITIPNSVTSIGTSAFSYCENLTSAIFQCPIVGNCFAGNKTIRVIVLDNGVTSIENYAFRGCSSLTSITIPNSVTSIGAWAFHDCANLTSVTIPNNVTSINESTFYGCSGLTSITIPNSVTSIGRDAFCDCKKLSSVNISDVSAWCNISFKEETSNPLHYAHHLFLNGKEIKKLIIPNDVTSIGSYAFCGGNFTSVSIGKSVTSIAPWAFSGCTNLTSITYLCPKVFRWYGNIKSIKEVILGEGVEAIEKNAFEEYKDFIVKPLSSTPPVLEGIIGKAVIEAPYGAAVNYASAEVWKDIDTIYSVKNGVKHYPIPIDCEGESIVEINGSNKGYEAPIGENVNIVLKKKMDCYVVTLNNMYIGNSLDKDGRYTFKPSQLHKENLIYSYAHTPTSVHIQTSGTLIDKIGIDNVDKIQSLKVTGDLNGTDILAIRKMTNLKLLDMSDANIVDGGTSYFKNYVTSKNAIGEYFFNEKKSVLRINLPNSISEIKGWAFGKCEKLMAVTIPNGVTSIGGGAFSFCENLTIITIPNSVSSIERYAFEYCSCLYRINMGIGIKTIGKDAFKNCTSLCVVNISDLNSWCKINFSSGSNPLSYAHNLYVNENIVKDLVIPSSIKSIKDYAFEGCTCLSKVIIPESVTSIGFHSFYKCSEIQSVTIGSNVTSIGAIAFDSGSFYYNGKMKYVTSLNPIPPETGDAFGSNYAATLFVPKGCKTIYWLHPYWEKFRNIVELEESEIRKPLIEKGNSTIYDLRGTKKTAKSSSIETLPKGIYIKDGKKVLVR